MTVLVVTAGAVKFPVESTVAEVFEGTDHTTSALPRESVAVSCTDWVEKSVAVVGVTEIVTGDDEAQPEIRRIKVKRKTQNTTFRVMTRPWREGAPGGHNPQTTHNKIEG
jgi:hypothetical protein